MSADLPLRFGDKPYTRIDPGETTIELSVRGLGVGASSAEQWWGPGFQNAIVMSNNAAGIPRVYVRTSRPIRTRLGEVEGLWMLGGLTESPFFDTDPRNDLRALSAAVFTLRLAADTGLTIGAERSVYAAAARFGSIPEHLMDVFFNWHRAPVNGAPTKHSDQLMGLFARWVFPASGFAAHVEWAKLRPPSSLRELLVEPERGQGYTVGVEWARPLATVTMLKFQAEATMLEQTPLVARDTVPEFYASHSVIQGYTQQGQVIGAWIGPGSSSQYLGATLIRRQWQVGGSLGRIRWDDDSFYQSPAGFVYTAHDVSLFAGLTGRYDARWLQIEASLVQTHRMNYLFQTANPYAFGSEFDIHNRTLGLRLTPHL